MKVVFRADASISIGSGHIMRCMTLAEILRNKAKADIHFICRSHKGHLLDLIHQKGFQIYTLPMTEKVTGSEENELPLSDWLGSSWQEDAEQTATILHTIQPDWLVTDHYALDYQWEAALKPNYRKLMVIDDLADRKHHCDLLLDQTFGRAQADYHHLVPLDSTLLIGSHYALLRPEFQHWREKSLKRRINPELKQLLINLGGVDKENITSKVLEVIQDCQLPTELEVNIIMGSTAPHLSTVKRIAGQMPFKTNVYCNVSNMAELMANSDLAIGASGSTTWERCCLGLPTIFLVLANNQQLAAKLLQNAGLGKGIEVNSHFHSLLSQSLHNLIEQKSKMRNLTENSIRITDGLGCNRVFQHLIN